VSPPSTIIAVAVTDYDSSLGQLKIGWRRHGLDM
jgi:hypothetical protein